MSTFFSYIASFFYSTEEEKTYDATFKLNKDDRLETSIIVKNNNDKYSCFATEPISKRYYTRYYGEYIDDKPEDFKYAWEIYDYDDTTGEPYYENIINYLDATNTDSWTKHIRHAEKEEEANITFQQYLDKMYYIVNKDINAGDELLIWCNQEYLDSL